MSIALVTGSAGLIGVCSMLEAVAGCERRTGRPMKTVYDDKHRRGDHIWWVSNIRKFQSHYPEFQLTFDTERILDEIFQGLDGSSRS